MDDETREAFAALKAAFDRQARDIRRMRADIAEKMDEYLDAQSSLRTVVETSLGDVRGEIAAVRGEITGVRGEISAARAEMRASYAGTEMRSQRVAKRVHRLEYPPEEED